MSANNEAEGSHDNKLQQMARARWWTLAAIRKAQGKPNPDDFTAGSVAWHEAVDDFAKELRELYEQKRR